MSCLPTLLLPLAVGCRSWRRQFMVATRIAVGIILFVVAVVVVDIVLGVAFVAHILAVCELDCRIHPCSIFIAGTVFVGAACGPAVAARGATALPSPGYDGEYYQKVIKTLLQQCYLSKSLICSYRCLFPYKRVGSCCCTWWCCSRFELTGHDCWLLRVVLTTQHSHVVLVD